MFVSAPDPRNVFSLSVSVAHSLLFPLQKNCRPASPRTQETSLMDLLSLSPLLSKLSGFLPFFTKSALFKKKSRENCPQPQDTVCFKLLIQLLMAKWQYLICMVMLVTSTVAYKGDLKSTICSIGFHFCTQKLFLY